MAVRIENFANTRARSNHKAVKCVNAEGRKCKYIAKFTCLPVRELASVPGWPPPPVYAELISPQCVPVLCHCWQTGPIGRAGGGCSHAILRPDSGQTRHRPLTKGGGSGEAVRQLVCVSMFMEYAFTPAVNFEYPNSTVAIEANNHVVSLTHLPN